MCKFIINADDLGLSHGVNQGILQAYQQGVVNSSSLMTNMPGFDAAIRMIKKHKLQNVGLHVNLTEGKSILTTHNSITTQHQDFYSDFSTLKQINQVEVYNEIVAQYQKALSAGICINHVDSHYHLHMNYSFQKAFIKFSNTYTLPLRKINYYTKYLNIESLYPSSLNSFVGTYLHRNYYTPYFTSDFFGDKVTKEHLMTLVDKYKGKAVEIMCHPGYVDEANGSYNQKREEELKLLCDPDIVALVKKV